MNRNIGPRCWVDTAGGGNAYTDAGELWNRGAEMPPVQSADAPEGAACRKAGPAAQRTQLSPFRMTSTGIWLSFA